jgi:hypothetical protein
MHGRLDPEEHVMEDTMTDPAREWPNPWLGQLGVAIADLEWEAGDDIHVEIGGMSVYGIEGDGSKWAPIKGTVKYNKDAFIVIKNRSRSPFTPSQPNPELKQAHPQENK